MHSHTLGIWLEDFLHQLKHNSSPTVELYLPDILCANIHNQTPSPPRNYSNQQEREQDLENV